MLRAARWAACWGVFAIAWGASSGSLAAQKADDRLHALIDLLDDHSPDTLQQAESLYAELTQGGASNVKGARLQEIQKANQIGNKEFGAINEAIRVEHPKMLRQMKLLRQDIAVLMRKREAGAPGRPSTPIKPTYPTKPSLTKPTEPTAKYTFKDQAERDAYDRDKDKYKREKEQYDRAMKQYETAQRSYQSDLAAYERDRATYPQRLAKWQADNEIFQAEKSKEIAAVQDQLNGLTKADAERNEARDRISKENASRAEETRDLEFRVRVFQTVASNRSELNAKRFLTLPSCYNLLSLSQERERLLQTLK